MLQIDICKDFVVWNLGPKNCETGQNKLLFAVENNIFEKKSVQVFWKYVVLEFLLFLSRLSYKLCRYEK